MNKKAIGIILSYILIVVDIIVGILFVPFLLKNLGANEYGLYKLMFSTASYLSVLDFGIGGTITRYVVKYRTEKKKKDEENFVAMGLVVYGGLSCLVLLIAFVVSLLIPQIYKVTIATTQMRYAQMLFLLICVNTSINLFNHAYNGLLTAYESFAYNKIINILKVIMRVGLIITGVTLKQTAFVIVMVDLFLSLMVLMANILYTKLYLKCCIKLHKWDFGLMKEAFVFTFAILLQSIINQFNSNVDNIVLGIYTTTAIVALYSIALQIFTMYSNLSTAVSSIYLPSISKAVFRGDDDETITTRVVEPSRLQLMVLMLALSGFILFGKEFLILWVGEEYLGAYALIMVLLISSTLELSQNSITSVLKAKNILHGKTLILLGATAVNTVITLILVPKLGAIGAAIGTAFSMIFGYGVALNIYYQKKAGLNMMLYYRKTYSGVLIAALVSTVLGYMIKKLFLFEGYLGFAIGAFIYSCVYIIIILVIGLNKKEKNKLKDIYFKRLGFLHKKRKI